MKIRGGSERSRNGRYIALKTQRSSRPHILEKGQKEDQQTIEQKKKKEGESRREDINPPKADDSGLSRTSIQPPHS
jgi:hypothetical protein